jgi:hypothetical protein
VIPKVKEIIAKLDKLPDVPSYEDRQKEYRKAYYQRPEVKARIKTYQQKPEYKAYRKAYDKAYKQRKKNEAKQT